MLEAVLPWFLTVTVMVTISSSAGSDGERVMLCTIRSGPSAADAVMGCNPDAAAPSTTAINTAAVLARNFFIIRG